MVVGEVFEGELMALFDLAPPLTRAGPRASVCSGNLEIAVTPAEDAITVELGGWQRRFVLDEEDPEAWSDQVALVLDLVGAALFGALRVVVEVQGGQPRRFTLQVCREVGWQTVEVQGARSWNPFLRVTSEVRVGATRRPARWAARAMVALPWAPWAGLAGYSGRGQEPVVNAGQEPVVNASLPAELAIDGVLDLHNFQPREVKPLVLAYIDACVARGITELRIVHGKGIGNLRRTVHALLERHPRVRSYRLGGHGGGSWGATLVDLSPGEE